MKSSPIWKIPDEEFINLVKSCKTYTEILAYFGLMNRGNNHETLKSRINALGLIFKSVGYNPVLNSKRKKPLSYFLRKGIKVTNFYLKKRLIKEGILKDECAICGLSNTWENKYLSLHLDHKNGDPTDHRKINLRLICPNCHSQTKNYCGKAKRLPPKFCKNCGNPVHRKSKTYLCFKCGQTWNKNFIKTKSFVKKPGKMELKDMLENMPVIQIGKKYGVSGNAVVKWMKKYEIRSIFGPGEWAKKQTKMPSKEILQKLSNSSSIEIASLYKVSPDTVRKWFKKHGIKRQTGSFWANKYWKNIKPQ